MVTDQELQQLQIDSSRKTAFEREKKTGPRPWIYLIAAAVVIGGGLFVWTLAFSTPALEVSVARARRESGVSGPLVLTAGGYIVAHHKIQVSSKVVGKVAWVGIEKGDRVKEGQVIVRLEEAEYRAMLEQAEANLEVAKARLKELEAGSRPQEIDAARAAVLQAEANFRNAVVNLKRIEDLARQDIAPQQQLDNARTQHEVTSAQLESARKNYELVKIGPRIEQIEFARAQVAQARAAADYARTMLESTRIRAPVTGTILERLVEKGEMVTTMSFSTTQGAKASVATLADLNDLQVELDIAQSDFNKLELGQKVVVIPESYPDRKYEGVLEEMSPEANRQKATVQVKVKILKPDAFLRPEMSAKASFLAGASSPSAAATSRVYIPRAAATRRQDKDVVYVVMNSRAFVREVELGSTSGSEIEVTRGLSGGEDLVVSELHKLKEGAEVRAK